MINAKERKVTAQLQREETRPRAIAEVSEQGRGRRAGWRGCLYLRAKAEVSEQGRGWAEGLRAQGIACEDDDGFSTNNGSDVLGARRSILALSRGGEPWKRGEEKEPIPGGARPSSSLIN